MRNTATKRKPERGIQSASPGELPVAVNGGASREIESPSWLKAALLVIGYGNTLRGDDGVGPRVAEAVDALHLPGVRTLACQQLTPEHAAPVSLSKTVIFVDAIVNGGDKWKATSEARTWVAASGEKSCHLPPDRRHVQWRKLEPNESSQLMAHAADPRTILALARDVFGHLPRAWWLTIPVVNLEF